MNKGLKSYTKQITKTIGNAGSISVNINQNDANMHMILPISCSIGGNTIELSLIYNYQDRNVNGLFGKGFKMNLFGEITDDVSSIKIRNADGSIDSYVNNEFNNETQLTISRKNDSYGHNMGYVVKDKYGNTTEYAASDLNYPSVISSKTDSVAIDFTKSFPTVSNSHGDVLTFKRKYENYDKIDRVTYSNDGISANTITNLHYDDSDRLVAIVFTNGTGLETSEYVTNKIAIEYGSDSITLIDEISGERCFCKFNSDGRVISITTAFNAALSNARVTSITYGGTLSTVTDNFGNNVKCIFDANDMPRFEMDSDGYIVETEYDLDTKQLCSQSSPIATKNKATNLLSSESIDIFANNGLTVTTATCTDDNFRDILGTSLRKVSGTGTLTKTLTYNGLATDNITVILWGKVTQGTVKVTLSAGGSDSEFFQNCGTSFDLMTLGTTSGKTFSEIKLTITLTNAVVDIGGIQLLEKNFGSFFNYDSNGNATQVGCRGTSEVSYDSNNLPAKSIGVDSTMVKYEYDNKCNLTKATTAYGVTIENEYDSHNNLQKTTYANFEGNKKLVSERTYTDDGRFVVSERDELGNSTVMEYNQYGNITKVTNALNVVTELSYANNGLLTQLLTKKSNESASALYEYDNRHLIKKVTLSNGSIYELVYDSQNRISAVKLNGYTVFAFVYDADGNITEQKYGKGDSFVFTYNADGTISQVGYKESASSAEVQRFSYVYNARKQLVTVLDKNNSVLHSYIYDADGRVTKVTSGATIEFGYDNLGNVNKESVSLSGKTVHQSFDTVQRSKGAHPESLLATTFGQTDYLATFEKDGALTKGEQGYMPIADVVLARDGIIPCARITQNKPMRYILPVYPMYYNDCGCIKFWFKMDNINSNCQLFYVKSTNNQAAFQAIVENKRVKVSIKNSSGNTYTLFTSEYEVQQGWNFFAFDYYNRDDGPYYSPFSEYAFTLNANTQFHHTSESAKFVEMSLNSIFCIGNKPDASNNMNGYIAALLISRDHRTLDKIKEYYRVSKDYIIDNQLIDVDAQTVDFGQTTLYNISATVQNNWDIVPLHSDVLSLKGTKPVVFDLRKVSSSDKDRTFNFNKKIKRYAYVADGSKLQYKFGQSLTGTIVMRVYTDVIADKQYLFEGLDANGKTLGLYRGNDLHLYIEQNGHIYSTNLQLTTNEWHTVALSFMNETSTSQSGIISLVSQIRVFLDGVSCDIVSDYVAFSDLTITIGEKTTSTRINTYELGRYDDYYPLHGQIEMLCANSAYNELSALQNLANEIVCESKATEYDELGMLKKQDVHKAGSTILANIYEYKTRSDTSYLSSHIKKETIKYGNTSNVRSYTTDALGRVTNITDSVFGGHTYTYDCRGFLTKADNETFTYDGNGNITSYNGTTFGYHSTVKDKLILVGNTAISYASVASLNPTRWGNNYYTFEGRRLVRFADTSGYRDYIYDENGLRIQKKKYTGETTYYYYSGTNLVVEKGTNYRLDFLYDENGQLYGLIKDNTNKYFYVKDSLGTILGIVNESGTLVAKYTYTAFGKCTIALNNDSIASMNPFRFKGYYYDTESRMYYCHTRYFVPEWGRWLNADHYEFLEFDNVNKANLFTYCGNDPINHIDPDGLAWYHWAIGAGIIVVCAALTVVTAGGFAAAGAAFASVVTATMAPTALSAIFAGATIGAAAIGVAGAVIGGKTDENGFSWDNDWSWENSSKGFMVGSIAGAVIGGAWGGAHYALQSAGKMAIRTNINNLINNPLDEFVTVGPKDGGISSYVRSINATGDYGKIYASKLQNGLYQIANGHHRVAALRQLGYRYVNFFLVP